MIVVGLDCAAPSLVFDRYRDAMPNVSALMHAGMWGELRSSEPPITVPAWTCMLSGRDPGELGLYGFRNRVEGGTKLRLATGRDVRVKRVWDWLGEHGHRVAPLFIPLTTPPTPVRGDLISGFLSTPDAPWTFPPSLAAELEAQFGTYQADVEDFRTDDLDRVYRDIEAMTRQHFAMAAYVWATREPSFMMLVEIGVDRFHHAFWHHVDPSHPDHDPTSEWTSIGRRYYALLDEEIGKLRSLAGDDVPMMVVSDHGARAMRGGFCVNEWLIETGRLVMRDAPAEPGALRHDMVDWSQTTAWAEGGYYARLFLNVKGREPNGTLSRADAARVKRTLIEELSRLIDDTGRAIPVEVHDPRTRYRASRGFPPDLMVYFDGLSLRAIGSVGHGQRVIRRNDTGPDTCNHDWQGVFVFAGPGVPRRGRIEGAQIYDVTPTILSRFGVERPPEILGRDWTDDRD
ncbi:MAG: alkaline phosphatase family protein [Myxococcota bacterium]